MFVRIITLSEICAFKLIKLLNYGDKLIDYRRV